jgi:hypothetical protein
MNIAITPNESMISSNYLAREINILKLGNLLAILIIALILLTCGCVQIGEVSKTISNQSSAQYILLNESGRLSNHVGNYTNASQGKTFLIINMSLENHGYRAFDVNISDFTAVIDNILYHYDNATFFTKSPLNSSTLFDSGKTAGHLVYQIPKNNTIYAIRYINSGKYYFIYKHLPKMKQHRRRSL